MIFLIHFTAIMCSYIYFTPRNKRFIANIFDTADIRTAGFKEIRKCPKKNAVI